MDSSFANKRYSKEQLESLCSRFLSKYPGGRIDRENFREISNSLLNVEAGVKMDSPIVERLFSIFVSYPRDWDRLARLVTCVLQDYDSNGYIDFHEFFALFSLQSYGTMREKFEFLFDLYDLDKSNYLSFYEIHSIVKIIFKLKSYDNHLVDIKNDIYTTDKKTLLTPSYYVSIDIMKKFDLDRNGKLTKEEFVEVRPEENSRNSLLLSLITF